MSTYRHRPHQVEAMQWTGRNWFELKAWFQGLKTTGAAVLDPPNGTGILRLQTEAIGAQVEVTDWIIRNRNGAIYMATDDAFRDTFDLDTETLDPDGGSASDPLGA